MTNSANTYGTFNKRTQTLSQVDDGSTALATFDTADEAKSFFYTTEALAVFDECCTELEWTVIDNNKLKNTITFGTKGGVIDPSDDWAGQFNSRKTALINAGNWSQNPYTTAESEDHLF
jgi:hypothetical protein